MVQFFNYTLLTALGIWSFWALYVFTMGIYRAKLAKRLTGLNLVLAFPIVVLAVLVDVFSNLFVAPILFLDIPREWLVTARMHRYIQGPMDWRHKIALWLCDSVLDPFDPSGNHC